MTGLDLIAGAMRLIGAIATGELPTASEAQDGLSAFNCMIDSWGNDRLLVYTLDHPVFALTPGKQDYTLGPGGDFNWSRPNKIESAQCRITNGVQPYDLPVAIVEDDAWAAITIKNLAGPFPYVMHNHGEYPLTTVSFFPVPNQSNSIVLYMWSQLQRLANLTTALSLPPGYERALKYNLAIDIAPEYEKEPSQALVGVAMESKAQLMRINTPSLTMKCDSITSGGNTFASNYSAIRVGN